MNVSISTVAAGLLGVLALGACSADNAAGPASTPTPTVDLAIPSVPQSISTACGVQFLRFAGQWYETSPS